MIGKEAVSVWTFLLVFFSLNLDFLLVLFCWWVNDLILPFFFRMIGLVVSEFLQDIFFLIAYVCSFFLVGVRR